MRKWPSCTPPANPRLIGPTQFCRCLAIGTTFHLGEPARPGSRASRGTERGFEQLNHVPGRVLDQDLLPARAGDDLVAEAHPFGAQPDNLAADVRHDEVDPVPAAGAGLSTIGHRPAR